jgi:hypothetical protein
MAGIKSSGFEVEMMIREGATLMEIEVATNWPADGIKALAVEVGHGVNAASGRFQKVAKAKPTPIGIVRNTLVAEAVASVALDGETQALDTECDVTDHITGRLCARPTGHDGNHQDRSGNRAWSQTDTGAASASRVNGEGHSTLDAPAPVSEITDDEPVRELTPPAPVPPSPSVSTVVEVGAQTSPPASTTVTDPNAPITAGLAHVDDQIGDLALQAKVALDRLAAALVDYEQRADALAEVHRLEAERVQIDDALVAARRAAGLDVPPVVPEPVMIPAPTKRKPVGVSFTEMREWAQAVGRDWGRGRPTNALIAEYRAATQAVPA